MNIVAKSKAVMLAMGAAPVMYLMIMLSILSLAIMLERAWLFWSLHDDIDALMRDLGRFLRGGDMEGARKRLEQSKSAEAAVVVAGLVESDLGLDAAEEAMAGASALQRLKLEKRLSYLGTLGNNAPFIGLLGTVIGIVGAFDELGKANALAPAGSGGASQIAPAAVMTNVGEALVATAVGIFVAIPAVAAFNAFQRLVRTTLANTDALGHVLLAHLKANPAAAAAHAASIAAHLPKNERTSTRPAAAAVTRATTKGSSEKSDDAEEEAS